VRWPTGIPSAACNVLLHVRAERNFCHELVRVIIDARRRRPGIRDHGIRWADNRDRIGCRHRESHGDERRLWTIVGRKTRPRRRNHVTVAPCDRFRQMGAIATEEQERAIGRRRTTSSSTTPSVRRAPGAHHDRAQRRGHKIVRHNLAWGTQRIGHVLHRVCPRPVRDEEMLERMFVADADGVYDRLVDSRPSRDALLRPSPVLEALADPSR
jgi:hypothetical protein